MVFSVDTCGCWSCGKGGLEIGIIGDGIGGGVGGGGNDLMV